MQPNTASRARALPSTAAGTSERDRPQAALGSRQPIDDLRVSGEPKVVPWMKVAVAKPVAVRQRGKPLKQPNPLHAAEPFGAIEFCRSVRRSNCRRLDLRGADPWPVVGLTALVVLLEFARPRHGSALPGRAAAPAVGDDRLLWHSRAGLVRLPGVPIGSVEFDSRQRFGLTVCPARRCQSWSTASSSPRRCGCWIGREGVTGRIGGCREVPLASAGIRVSLANRSAHRACQRKASGRVELRQAPSAARVGPGSSRSPPRVNHYSGQVVHGL